MSFVPSKLRHAIVLTALAAALTACGGGGGGGGGGTPSGPSDVIGDIGQPGGGSGVGNPPQDGKHYVVLTWEAPVTREDGSCLDALTAYEISYGLSPGNYDKTITVDVEGMAFSETGRTTDCGPVHSYSYLVEDLGTGSWYFAVRAVDAQGNVSKYSNEAIRTLQ